MILEVLATIIRQRKEEIKGKLKGQKDMLSILKQWLSCIKMNESTKKIHRRKNNTFLTAEKCIHSWG